MIFHEFNHQRFTPYEAPQQYDASGDKITAPLFAEPCDVIDASNWKKV